MFLKKSIKSNKMEKEKKINKRAKVFFTSIPDKKVWIIGDRKNLVLSDNKFGKGKRFRDADEVRDTIENR